MKKTDNCAAQFEGETDRIETETHPVTPDQSKAAINKPGVSDAVADTPTGNATDNRSRLLEFDHDASDGPG